jgi:transcription antitermination protein NusB
MTSRREARRAALFMLFQWDVTGKPLGSTYEGEVDDFARETADAVAERAAELDRRIDEATDDWPADRLGALERNVLRIGIYELLVIDAAIRQLILDGAPADSIRNAARASGMEPLGQDAWRKVLAGLTSLEEVRPLLSLLADEAPVCPACGANIRRTFSACTQCGHTLRPRCACGEPLDPTWLWCPECGTRQA